MANTFKVVTFAAEPNAADTPYTVYTTPSSTTTVVIGLILTNIHTSQVTAEVELETCDCRCKRYEALQIQRQRHRLGMTSSGRVRHLLPKVQCNTMF